VDASGCIWGTATVGFGNGVTATGTSASYNVLLVQYDPSGQARSAGTLTAGTNDAFFQGLAADNSGGIFAVGINFGTGTYGFGNGVTVAGAGASYNALLVKYR
jgi:hypothetical protein